MIAFMLLQVATTSFAPSITSMQRLHLHLRSPQPACRLNKVLQEMMEESELR